MKPDDFIDGAKHTEPCVDDFNSGGMALDDGQIRILHAAMGFTTETGEFMDELKRHLFYRKDLDKVNLVEEAGDILWYMAILLDEIGYSFEEVMKINNAKLRKRFPNKFSAKDAIRRDTDAEREVLEREADS